MTESGARDLQLIEQALLADDPHFIARFEQATQGLVTPASQAPPGPIVIPVDGTLTSMQAVHWAASRARSSGAEIRIVHAFRWRSFPTDYGASELADLSLQQAGEDICSSAVDLASAIAPASRISGTLIAGSPGPAIVEAARGAAMIVLSGSRRGWLPTLLRISTLPHVLDRTRCAVAVLPDAEAARPAPAAPARVCVGADGGPGDLPALAEALHLAVAHGLELLVVCAPGSDRAAGAALASLHEHPAVPVETMTARDRLVDTLGRLAPSAHSIVCDREQLRLCGTWRGASDRRLLRDAGCPVLLTRATAEPSDARR